MEDEEVSKIFRNMFGSGSVTSNSTKSEEAITLHMSCDEESTSSSPRLRKQQKRKRKQGYKKGTSRKKQISSKEVKKKYLSASDTDIDEEDRGNNSEAGISEKVRKDTKRKSIGSLDLHFVCEWKNCSFETDEDFRFHMHVSYHIPDLEIKTLGNGEEVYVCLWAECSYWTGVVKEIQRHVTYHSYHTKLKNIGAKLCSEWKLPKCMYGFETKNMIPENIDPMVCEWKGCSKEGREFNNVQVFLHHIQMHVKDEMLSKNRLKKEKNVCKWDGCMLSCKGMTKASLAIHLRTHTQEKVVGCPICGHLFSTNTKLIDHCERQLPQDFSEFQCVQCYKYFPNFRLLKDHIRGHINYYKCCYCDMTTSSKRTYSAHIRYKHLDSKPFQCNTCQLASKTQQDLKLHLLTHEPTPPFQCEVKGCEFTCRSKRTLPRHMVNVHQIGSTPVYACHLANCRAMYRRGSYLTKHLMTKHRLHWPSGHSKFMYTKDVDGILRLQTVRYESDKLYSSKNSTPMLPKSNFKITPQAGEGSRSFKISTLDSESESASSKVEISIKDEKGNTINSCTTTDVVVDKLPKNAMVIASADSDVSNDGSDT